MKYSHGMILLGTLALAQAYPALAQSPRDVAIDEIVGHYRLTREIQGHCYPEIDAVREEDSESKVPSLGIYGKPGSGEIVFQMTDINEGRKTAWEENPMWGGYQSVRTLQSVLKDGKIDAFNERRDFAGALLDRSAIQGTYGNGTLSFTLENEIHNIGYEESTHSQCVYSKT